MPIYNPIQINLNIIENLSTQCDGSTTVFNFSKKIIGIYWVNLNGTLLIDNVDFTINSNKEGITLISIVPDSDEQLYVKVLI